MLNKYGEEHTKLLIFSLSLIFCFLAFYFCHKILDLLKNQYTVNDILSFAIKTKNIY
jgi:hypothetical protein